MPLEGIIGMKHNGRTSGDIMNEIERGKSEVERKGNK
jgi:hypothetical protein